MHNYYTVCLILAAQESSTTLAIGYLSSSGFFQTGSPQVVFVPDEMYFWYRGTVGTWIKQGTGLGFQNSKHE